MLHLLQRYFDCFVFYVNKCRLYFANLSKRIGESICIAIAILFKFGIGIGIANTFTKKYWYWYCQYFFPVLLTALLESNLCHCEGTLFNVLCSQLLYSTLMS